jgi:ABC-type nickel/cobalt efflux system permease component RcnA
MVTAIARGVPAAGLTFAASMFAGIALTLGIVAVIAIIGRDVVMQAMTRYGTSIATVGRLLDGIAGSLLVLFGIQELLR